MNKKNTINYPKSAATGFFSKGLKNEFETAVVNEPSVFEPLKFYCMFHPITETYAFLLRLKEHVLSFTVFYGLLKQTFCEFDRVIYHLL